MRPIASWTRSLRRGLGPPASRDGLVASAVVLVGAAAWAQGPPVAKEAEPMARRTAFVCSPRYRDHVTGPGHPEQASRLDAIEKHLAQTDLAGLLLPVEPTPAPLEWVTRIHSPDYVARARRLCAEGTAFIDTTDVPVTPASYETALLAAGGVLAAVDAVADGRARNAFCAVRPPGHHALRERAMGFCLFNNVAIAARYAQDKRGFAKILIVDWDVHHGNGTQAAFYDDPSVFYFSVHQDPFYPGTGHRNERGTGKGWSFTCNVPLPAGSDDATYAKALAEELVPAAEDFAPDFVFVSAGFDAHRDDPLGGMRLTPEGYAAMTRTVKQIAARCCGGRIVSVLEGGYDLDGLAASVEAHLRALLEP